MGGWGGGVGEGEREFPPRRKRVKYVQKAPKLTQHMYPMSNQALRLKRNRPHDSRLAFTQKTVKIPDSAD